MNLVDFDACPQRKNVRYGGAAGAKIAVSYNDEIWLVKFPKSTREFNNAGVSYTTSPVNEYLGSQIYGSLGIPVHETVLGHREGRVVVGCKDFVNNGHNGMSEFLEIKNSIVPDEDDPFSMDASGNSTKLSSILYVLDRIAADPWYASVADIKERFWDMFVVDAFIRNNDRNNGNWGILEKPDGTMELAPVYDNGNSFFTTRRGSQNAARALDDQKVMDDAFGGLRSIFEYDDGHRIEPFSFMARHEYPECDAAISRFVERCDMRRIEEIVRDIPETWQGKDVMPEGTKDLYVAILRTHQKAIEAIGEGRAFTKELRRELVQNRGEIDAADLAEAKDSSDALNGRQPPTDAPGIAR